jgi:hypothetical protein
MFKYATTSAPFRNKNLRDQHLFLPFKTTNDIVQCANNSATQLKEKINIRKHGHMNHLSIILNTIDLYARNDLLLDM